jgi:hypothetical protein
VRGNRDRQQPISDAINTAKENFITKTKIKNDAIIEIQGQTISGEPCLQIADYINWAVQRVYTKGEDRFFNTIADKIKFIVDLYDTAKYPNNFYSKTNPFTKDKISPL